MSTPTSARPAGAAPSAAVPGGLDPRGLRFAATLTSLVLAAVLVTGSTWLLAAQTAVFAVTVWRVRWSPYGQVYARVVRPRLGPPAALEDPRPARFAQLVGLTFAVVGLVAAVSGAALVSQIAVGLALAAALLNAAAGICLGCELYLLGRRVLARPATPRTR